MNDDSFDDRFYAIEEASQQVVGQRSLGGNAFYGDSDGIAFSHSNPDWKGVRSGLVLEHDDVRFRDRVGQHVVDRHPNFRRSRHRALAEGTRVNGHWIVANCSRGTTRARG